VASGVIYWVDRCLGTNIVPSALRAIGVQVQTYDSLYPNDTRVPDHVWIPEVAQRGWVILTKDKRIRHAREEIDALRSAGARYVCLSSAQLTGSEQAECLVRHWKTIDSVVINKPAPLIVSVTRQNVQWLDELSWRVAKRKR
jgi:hypothetical protein